jgi:hypothetical protein
LPGDPCPRGAKGRRTPLGVPGGIWLPPRRSFLSRTCQ